MCVYNPKPLSVPHCLGSVHCFNQLTLEIHTFSNKSDTNYCMWQHAEEHFFALSVHSYILHSDLLKYELTHQIKPTTLTRIQKQLLKKKAPSSSFFFILCLKNVNGCFLLPPLLFFRGGRALWSIALVSHREGIPEVSVGPLICVLHCPNSLCLLFSLYLSPSVSLDPLSQQAGLA